MLTATFGAPRDSKSVVCVPALATCNVKTVWNFLHEFPYLSALHRFCDEHLSMCSHNLKTSFYNLKGFNGMAL